MPNPEPRAIAHQQAYCLTPNFPSCAFFIDWAARAAAAPLAGSGAGFGAAPLPGNGYGAYGGAAGQPAELESPGAADPVGRAWAAPPPWVGDPDLRATQTPAPAWSPPPQNLAPQPPYAPPYVPPVPPAPIAAPVPQPAPQSWAAAAPAPAIAASGEEPEQLMALPEPDEPEADRDYDLLGGTPLPLLNEQPATLDSGSGNPDPGILPVPHEDYPEDDPAPLAQDQVLAPLPPTAPAPMPEFSVPPPSSPAAMPSQPAAAPASSVSIGSLDVPQASYAPPVYPPSGPETWSHPAPAQGSMPDDMAPLPPVQRAPAYAEDEDARPRLSGRPIDAGGPPRFSPQARQPLKKRTDGEWSKPRRFEAYPTLGGRMRGFSPVLIGAFVVAIVALLLFLLPGFLGASPAPTRTPAVATATPIPTPTPAPTIETHTVKAGETLSAIAKSFGLTVDQMACYNNLKNANTISIGQVLKIPPADYECPQPTPKK